MKNNGLVPQGGAGMLEFIGPGAVFKGASGFKNAITIFKGGLTPAGRGLAKHPNILRLVSTETVATNAQKNKFAALALKYIMRNGVKNVKPGKINGQIVNFVDYKLANGLGARFYEESNEFFGFLGRGL